MRLEIFDKTKLAVWRTDRNWLTRYACMADHMRATVAFKADGSSSEPVGIYNVAYSVPDSDLPQIILRDEEMPK